MLCRPLHPDRQKTGKKQKTRMGDQKKEIGNRGVVAVMAEGNMARRGRQCP